MRGARAMTTPTNQNRRTQRKTMALVPQILNHRLFRRTNERLKQLRAWSRVGSALWLTGTVVGILGGHIIVEAGITGLGLASLVMGIIRSA